MRKKKIYDMSTWVLILGRDGEYTVYIYILMYGMFGLICLHRKFLQVHAPCIYAK